MMILINILLVIWLFISISRDFKEPYDSFGRRKK